MPFNATDLQNLIIASLSNAEPTALERLQTNVPLYWSIHSRQPIDELRYWYVRRDAIKLCMGCNTRAIDNIRRTQNAQRNAIESQLQDSTMDATSVEDSESVADRLSNSIYDAETNSEGTGSNSAARNSSQSSESDSDYDDVGSGTNTTRQIQHQETESDEVGDVEYLSTEAHEMHHARDAGDNLSTHYLSTRQSTEYGTVTPADFGLAGFPNGFPVGFLQTTTTESDSTVTNDSQDDTYSTVPNSTSDTPVRTTDTNITVRVMPQRTATMSMYDVPMTEGGAADLNPASTRKSTQSTFNANVTQSETAEASSTMTASSQAQSNSEMEGSGSGSSESSGTSSSTMTATSERVGSGSGNSARSNQALAQMNSLMERLHQRFDHLQELWKQANEMIKLFESQNIGTNQYVFAQIAIVQPEGYNMDTNNLYLIKQPCNTL